LASILLAGTSYAQLNVSLPKVQKSTHCIIYYQDAPLGYVDNFISKAEYYYNSITEELGFTRFEGFWTWDKRVKIYLFKDRGNYQKMTNQPAWSGGEVNVLTREISTYINMEDFFEVILPHEMGHIIFREFIGYQRKLPLWLDEGIASFLEKRQKQERLRIAKGIVNSNVFLDLAELGKIKRNAIFMPDIFYAEAASIIEFLVKVYGKDKFTDFCQRLKQLRDDQDWKIALYEAYNFQNLSEMNEKWEEFLRR
jgi:hypothetical protein